MNRSTAIDLILDAVSDRRLIWLGIAGEDAGPLLDIPRFSNCYSVHSPLKADTVESHAIESLTGWRRRDIDIQELLADTGKPMVESFRKAVSEPALLITNTPYGFTPLLLANGLTRHLGNDYGTFRAVSNKPLAEAELARAGVQAIPWRHLPDHSTRMTALQCELGRGPIVLRSSKQDSGAGHELIRHGDELESSAIAHLHESISVAPFLAEHTPTCIGACVFPDGATTVHTPSLQLIGIEACSRYDFGYCGNDFGAIAQLSRAALEGLEASVKTVGAWLHSRGFVGAFGVDALVRDDESVFVEVNPRFLGSSRVSAGIDAELDRPDVYFDHLMACLGMPSYRSLPLVEQAATQPARSQIICHNLRPEVLILSQDNLHLPPEFTIELAPAPTVRIAPEYLLFVLKARASVTSDGKSITQEAAAAMEAALAAFAPSM